jgi:hypothetical protein
LKFKEGVNQLIKFNIKLKFSSYFKIKNQIEHVFNQFIDHLNLPISKFDTKRTILETAPNKYTSFYEDFMNEENYENFYEETQRKTRLPSLQ